MITRLRARWVLGFDEDDHVLHEDACVVYDGDTIVHVGPVDARVVDRDRDFGDALICPGFIDLNALGDIDHAVLDHWQGPDRQDALMWSLRYFERDRAEVFDLDEILIGRRYALAQLLLNGVTTALPIAAETYRAWAETYAEFAGVAEIAAELGIRAYLGPSYRGGVNVLAADGSSVVAWDREAGRRSFEEAVAFARDGARSTGLIRTALVPARVETLGPELMAATAEAARELDVPIRFHAAQSVGELRQMAAQYGRHSLGVLDDHRLLGPRTLIAHCWAVNGHSQVGAGDGTDHLALLVERSAHVVYCPMAGSRYGMVLESFDEYLRRGVSMALGTDTFPPDMIRVMESASSQARLLARRHEAGQAPDLLRAATLGGAAALGRTDLGRIAPGAQADLVVVDLGGFSTGVVADPVRAMVNHAHGGCVSTVVVAGRTVVEDGRIPGVDLAELRAQASRLFVRYRSSYERRDHLRRDPDTIFPGSFRTIIARGGPGR